MGLGKAAGGWDSAAASGAAGGAASGFQTAERIRRSYSETSVLQAAFQMDQMRLMRLGTLPAAERAAQLTETGREYLQQGLLPEAEQEFQNAIAADPANASAYASLAQVREQSGDATAARTAAQSCATGSWVRRRRMWATR